MQRESDARTQRASISCCQPPFDLRPVLAHWFTAHTFLLLATCQHFISLPALVVATSAVAAAAVAAAQSTTPFDKSIMPSGKFECCCCCLLSLLAQQVALCLLLLLLLQHKNFIKCHKVSTGCLLSLCSSPSSAYCLILSWRSHWGSFDLHDMCIYRLVASSPHRLVATSRATSAASPSVRQSVSCLGTNRTRRVYSLSTLQLTLSENSVFKILTRNSNLLRSKRIVEKLKFIIIHN